MGTWGTAIFSDDLASDIKGDYLELIGDGKNTEEATAILMNEYKSELIDQYNVSVFWLSLAAIQWKSGRLVDNVKQKALAIIDQGNDLNRWKDNNVQYQKRKKVLQKLKNQLLSPQPIPKKIPKRFRNSTDWEIGDVVSYKTLSDKYILFRVIGFHEDKGGRAPVCELLDWIGQIIPSEKEINKLKIKIHKEKNNYTVSKFLIGSTSVREFPVKRVKLILKNSQTSQNTGVCVGCVWRFLDRQLKEIFNIE
jgi:hypothetical protein